ncbi:Multimodular transpeptidase-transglycosylase [Paramagnetospirillum magnetotacticum MS-1]|uniref:Multimodular transpeptidase-transglycosylase n=1 Tax=Paramagnetospirillum magnetotacticum MS-1 TaxID=272627 RepID=A0A0C2UX21_PARME|nr:PBP1A family penicillin-binding protein [Paramagnetospirillum magnetotacticum]KIL97381.1 Multimodular transpeptidase-transglycosylase [Paramagnetospirillum magnetotacticum MS-1]
MAVPPSRPKGAGNPFKLSIDPADRLLPSGSGGEPPPPREPPPPAHPRAPKEPRKPKAAKKGGSGNGQGRKWAKRLLLWGLTLAIWVGIGLGGVVAYYALDLPDIDRMTAQTRRPSVVFQSVEGEVFAAYGDLYGEPLDLGEMSPFIAQAVLATEDRRFYSHWGVDPIGLLRALFVNLRAGHTVQGGSTITQQLAKNLFLTPERNMKRKVQEVLMALWLEKRFSKDQILGLYLNRVYLGSGTFGVDAAAKRYFDISARKVDVYQAAVLAGLLKAPSRYSPLNDPEASRKRTSDVLSNMVKAGYIDQKTADTVQVTGAAQLVRRPIPAGRYFADWVMGNLDQFGEVAGKDIVVHTTLDISLQRKVEADLKTMITGPGAKANASQGAVVVMSPDGAIRALTGGKDYDDSQFNRATQGLRQPGSSFKPFVYLTAVEMGRSPDDEVEDKPIRLGNWSPGNYTGKYLGPITLRQALAESVNTVAVRLVEEVGPGRVIATARRLGITSDLRNDATLALGTSEVSLLEMTTAYAAFANGGYGVTSFGVSHITDPSGKVLFQRQGGGFGQVISASALARMHDMMSAVINQGSGKAARLDRPAAGKTGTTQDYRDAWFMGFTADYVTGVWLGNDDYRIEMKKVTGGGLPAQLWKQVMVAAHRGLPARPLRTPEIPTEPGAETGVGDFVAGAAQAAGDAARGIGGAIDDLLKGIFGR